MAKITLVEQETILTFPVDSILELKIEEANVKTVQGRNTEWQKVEVKFKILGIQAIGDGGPVADYENWITQHIWGSVPLRLTDSPENKLRIWSEAIFRQELGVGFELDSGMWIGRKVRGITSQYDARGRGSDGQPFKRHQVETLLPFGDTSTTAPATTPAVSAPSGSPQPVAAGADPWGDSWKGDEPPF